VCNQEGEKMKKRISRKLLLAVFLVTIIFTSQLVAQVEENKYFSVEKIILNDGTTIDKIIISGPPTPPPGFERTSVVLPEPNPAAGTNVLLEVPAFDWSFGCSATSAAMIAGYYDRHGSAEMYTGPTDGGVMPLDNSSWPDWYDGHAMRHQCPLSATRNELDGRAIKGHVDDYWIYYGQPGPDPWDGNWTEHTYGDCTGDYMKTNQWVNPGEGFNTDGSTTFYNYNNGAPLPWDDMEGYSIHIYDGGYGLKLFYESRGYTVTNMYNQYIDALGLTYGFTYAQYKAEIDAGRPVMVHLAGHTVVGVGYDDATNKMYIHDTWDYDQHEMTWGGEYSGMQHRGISIVQLVANTVSKADDYGGGSVAPGTSNVRFLQLGVQTDSGTATITSVKVKFTSSSSAENADISAFDVYDDANGNGQLDDGDPLKTVSSPDLTSGATASGLSFSVTTTTKYLLLVLDIASGADSSHTAGLELTDNSFITSSDGTVSSSNFPIKNISDKSLPVELSSFSAISTAEGMVLSWRTETEVNNSGFNVYRSNAADGKYDKLNATLIKGAGTDATPHDYSFTDENVMYGGTYYYYIEDVDFSGRTNKSHIIKVTVDKQGIKTHPIPQQFALLQNYPNPFNPETWMPYQLAKDAPVTIRVYNTRGQLARLINLGMQQAGDYLNKNKAAYWDGYNDAGERVTSGIYFYHLQADGFSAVRRMVIVK